MSNMLLIAKREYLEQIRGRAFRLSTIGLPVLFAVIIGVGYLASLGLGDNKRLVITATDPALAVAIRNQLMSDTESKATVDVVVPDDPDTRAALLEQLQAKSIDGVLSVDAASEGVPKATYTSQSSGDFIINSKLEKALDDGLVDQRLNGAGMNTADADAALKGIPIQSFQVKKDGSIVKTNAEASFWKGYVMALLLSMTTMIYGLNVARSIIQEKTSRIFEVSGHRQAQ